MNNTYKVIGHSEEIIGHIVENENGIFCAYNLSDIEVYSGTDFELVMSVLRYGYTQENQKPS